METQAAYLNRERMLKENAFMRDLLTLKRYPLMKSYNPDYVKEFRLLQGECGLPSKHEVEAGECSHRAHAIKALKTCMQFGGKEGPKRENTFDLRG